MRVLIVDDSAFMRRAIKQMLETDPTIQVVGLARHGREGLELAEKLKPDLITMDIEMPEMDGLTCLRHVMRQCPTQVLMLSSLTTEGSQAALTALKLGAADFLAKDMSQVSLSITTIQDELLTKARALGSANKGRFARRPATSPPAHLVPVFRPGQFDVICIGSSTGGPPILEKVLPALPPTLVTPVVVAQHMPELFTRTMAERLNESCQLPVVHANDHMPLQPRTIYIAPGKRNIHLHKLSLAKWEILVNDLPASSLYRPSVDALFDSAATATGKRTLGIVMTGIGEDGLIGGRALHAAGGTLLAQSEETCVVYGMPKAITQAALIVASLSPDQIITCLQSLARNHPADVPTPTP
ncbi:MAG: chemotaxis response regulator protein-glutamate methylesterase [Phycisphaeraceae bacterium]|nr:chemotaxis response regulator protein-glutamate methylesterase [Phycisphaeraceae bacterium]